MNEFYCSARGISARSWLDESKKQRKMLSWPPIKIIFPSLQTVEDSISGYSVRTETSSYFRYTSVVASSSSHADWIYYTYRGLLPCFVRKHSGNPRIFHVTFFMTRIASVLALWCIQRYAWVEFFDLQCPYMYLGNVNLLFFGYLLPILAFKRNTDDHRNI